MRKFIVVAWCLVGIYASVESAYAQSEYLIDVGGSDSLNISISGATNPSPTPAPTIGPTGTTDNQSTVIKKARKLLNRVEATDKRLDIIFSQAQKSYERLKKDQKVTTEIKQDIERVKSRQKSADTAIKSLKDAIVQLEKSKKKKSIGTQILKRYKKATQSLRAYKKALHELLNDLKKAKKS